MFNLVSGKIIFILCQTFISLIKSQQILLDAVSFAFILIILTNAFNNLDEKLCTVLKIGFIMLKKTCYII